MRRRERYSMQLTCPGCGKIGWVVWTGSPVLHGGVAPSIFFSGFRTGPGTDRAGFPALYCDACNTPVGL